ncbi:MAG: hypothetical protein HQL01_13910 [Nitrospirae bacterium]|nr:hypothetical protein [Nitrospirota bacterium]
MKRLSDKFKQFKPGQFKSRLRSILYCTILLSAILLLPICIFASTTAGAAPYSFVAKWGGCCSGKGQLNGPFGVAVNSTFYVFVADTYNNRCQIFSSTSGGFLGTNVETFGSKGQDKGQFITPQSIAVDSLSNDINDIYVADTGNNRIQKFKSGGYQGSMFYVNFDTMWDFTDTGSAKTVVPFYIAIGGFVYITDYANDQVLQYTKNGSFVRKWGSTGSGDGQFRQIGAIAVDNDEYVYVADTGNQRVQKFKYTGEFVTKWGSDGSGDGQFWILSGIAADNNGYIHTTDQGYKVVQKFKNDGTFVTKWHSDDTGGGQFMSISAIAVDNNGYVYVTDPGNWNVQSFKPNDMTLTVTKSGSGSGTISPDSGTISWSGNTGTASYKQDTPVVLTATVVDSNSKLSSWSGCDSTDGSTCTVAMSSAKSVTATFSILKDFSLTVTKSSSSSGFGTGSATVLPSMGTISWSGNTGTVLFKEDTSLYLNAIANSGYTFSYWIGCDTQKIIACYVSMSSDRSVTAVFSNHYDAASAGIDFIYSTVGKLFGAKKGGISTYQTQYGTYYVQEYESGALVYAWYDGYMYAYDLTNYIPTGVIWNTTLSESHSASAKIAESYNQYASYFGIRSGDIIKGTDVAGTYYVQWFTNGRAIIAWTDGYVYYYNGTGWVSSGISWR